MSVREIKRHLVPGTHNEHVVLEDSMGVRHDLIIPLVETTEIAPGKFEHRRSDPERVIEEHIAFMEAREKIALEHAADRGHVASSLPDATGDCGCQ